MKTTRIIYLFSLIAAFLFSCDKMDDPEVRYGSEYRVGLYGEAPTFPIVETPVQSLLLEDFTGQDCGNCPVAHGIAREIIDENPGRVAVVAVHAGTLAQPYPPNFPDDWTTPEGSYYLLTQVGADEMPKGRINRTPDAHTVYSPSQWKSKATDALQETADVQLQLKANYIQSNNHLNIHVNHQWFTNLDGEYRLIIMVTESHIIAPQLWYNHTPEYVPEYEQNHMLRKTLTGATGLVVADNPKSSLNQTDSYTVNWNDNWIPENCDIVAFITEGENGRVLNCVEVKLKE